MTGDIVQTPLSRRVPHTVALVVIGVVGLVLACILTGVTVSITTRGWDEPGDGALLVGLGAWTQIAVVVGIVALAGAVVLAGVSEIARRAIEELAHSAKTTPR